MLKRVKIIFLKKYKNWNMQIDLPNDFKTAINFYSWKPPEFQFLSSKN